MAQKAAKQIARRNATALNQLHIISASIHAFFIFYRLLIHRRSISTSVLTKYVLFSLPAVLIELYLEKISRPKYAAGGDLRRAGEDLDAKGLMEYMWDVVYVTWGCLIGAALLGEWFWWLLITVPLYAGYLAVSTFLGIRKTFGGMGGGEAGEGQDEAGLSNRQKKLEKKGGQKIRYR
ncbi:DUF788 domain protein [Kalaharituber pfeilii]|nr:DUF788 domain protein [Kalaharituber pfeilii]